jgi:hypothetical protein
MRGLIDLSKNFKTFLDFQAIHTTPPTQKDGRSSSFFYKIWQSLGAHGLKTKITLSESNGSEESICLVLTKRKQYQEDKTPLKASSKVQHRIAAAVFKI